MKAADKSLDSVGKSAETATSSIVKIASGIGVFKAVSAGINLIKSSVDGAVSRIDTLNNANRVFQNMGFSTKDTKAAMDALNKSIKGMPTALNDGVQGMEMLASSMGDIGKAQQVFSALNDGILGFGGTTEQVSGAVRQLSQAFAGGKVDAETWNSMLDSGLGPALNAIAKTMGKTTAQLKDGLSTGKISVGQFEDALISLDQNGGGGLQSLHQIAQDALGGISTSMTNAKTAVTRGVGDIISAIDKGLAANKLPGIAASISAAGSMVENALSKLAGAIPGVINKIVSFGHGLIPWAPIMKAAGIAVGVLVGAILGANKINQTILLFQSLGKAIGGTFSNLVSAAIIAIGLLIVGLVKLYQNSETFRNSVNSVGKAISSTFGPAIEAVRKVLSGLSDSTQNGITSFLALSVGALMLKSSLGGLIGAFTRSKTGTDVIGHGLSSVISKIPSLVAGFGNLGRSVGSTVIGSFSKLTLALGPAGTSLSSFLGRTRTGSQVISAFSRVTGLLGPIFSALAGPIGIAIGAITGISAIVALSGSSFDSISEKVTQFGNNFAKAGPIVGQAMGQIVQGITTGLASALPGITTGLMALSTSIATFAPVIGAAVGTALQGLLTGIATAIPGIVTGFATISVTIAGQIPVIVSVLTLVFAALSQSIAANMPTIVASVGLLITTFLTSLSTQLPQIMVAGTQLIVSFLQGLAQALPQIMPAAIQVIVAFINGLASGIGPVISAGANFIVKLLQGLTKAIPTIIPAAVEAIVTFVEGIGNNLGKIINAAVDLIGKFIVGLTNAIPKITAYAVQAVERFVYGVGNALGQVLASGTKLIGIFVKGVLSGLSNSGNAGKNNAKSVDSGIKGFSLLSAGADLIKGFIKGINGMVKNVINAAKDLAGKAVNAVKSALKIGSPSKVMAKMGMWTGAGFINGIDGMIKPVDRMATRLADAAVPEISTVDFTPTFDTNSLNSKLQKASSMMSDQLNSQMNSNLELSNAWTVEVPVNLDSNEIARVTAKPMQNELNRLETQYNRVRGQR